MNDQITELTDRVEKLEERCAWLTAEIRKMKGEKEHLVVGWESAARIVKLCSKTIRERTNRGDFPSPIEVRTVETKAGKRQSPVWHYSTLMGLVERSSK